MYGVYKYTVLTNPTQAIYMHNMTLYL
jgi:hypothetical protein